jgi:23S rRNA (uridine2552-2'-O)-methyltransferase
MTKNKFSKEWLQRHLDDPYVKLAQQKGYRTRAAFKLIEILDDEHLMHRGDVVVDLGAAPGSWAQVARERLLGSKGAIDGRIVALDILPWEPVAGVDFIQGDFRDELVLKQLENSLAGSRVDLILSDMSPNLSGVKAADAARIQHLCELVLEFSLAQLKPDGTLIMKAFHGSGFSQIVQSFKQHFKRVAERKPKASRAHSAETFLVVKNRKVLR